MFGKNIQDVTSFFCTFDDTAGTYTITDVHDFNIFIFVRVHIFGTQCLLFDRKFLRNFLSKNALPTCRTFSFRSLFYRNVIQSSPDIFSAQSGSLLLDRLASPEYSSSRYASLPTHP